MPGETVATVHVDVLLSNLARLYRPTSFIADQVCPYLGVTHESDLYPVFNQGEFYATDTDDLVADRSEPRVVEFAHTTETYRTQRRELAWDISDRERKNADSQIRLERNKQVGTLGRLLLKREIRVQNLLRKVASGGKLNLGANAAAAWDTANTTSIETDIWTGREAVRTAIGQRCNMIVIPEAVAAGMQKNTQLVGKLQYTYGSGDSRPLLESYYPILPPVLFGMRVVIPGEIKNTANEGATASYSDIWGEAVRLLYVTTGPDLETPSVAYTFRSEPMTTRRSREDKPRKDWFAVGQTIDERVVAPDAGYEIANCLA